MDEYTIRQAIDLIRARRYADARKLLRPVLEVTPTNEAAWIWFTSTYTGPAEKLQVYQVGLHFCPDSEKIKSGIEKCNEEIAELRSKGEEPEPVDILEDLPANAQVTKKKEPYLQLPEDGKPFDWNEPLTTPTHSVPNKLKEETPQPKIKMEAFKIEPQPSDWMDSLRGTMDDTDLETMPAAKDGENQPGSEQAGVEEIYAKPVPDSQQKSDESISNNLLSIWGKISETSQKWVSNEKKVSTDRKIDLNTPLIPDFDQAAENEIIQPGVSSDEQDPNLNPIPPVIRGWNLPEEDDLKQKVVNPWDFPDLDPESTPESIQSSVFPPFGSDPVPVKNNNLPAEMDLDPYQRLFNLAAGLGVFLALILAAIVIVNNL